LKKEPEPPRGFLRSGGQRRKKVGKPRRRRQCRCCGRRSGGSLSSKPWRGPERLEDAPGQHLLEEASFDEVQPLAED
jgi:hypothetical protein